MGEHAQITADRFGIGRREQDELALASHKNLAKAYESGFFQDLVMPYHGLERDNNLRPDSTLEKLAKLPGAFATGGSISAANASPLTDGASAVLLCCEAYARARGLPVLAWISAAEVSAVDFREEREGLLMAPAYAVPRMLAKRELKLQDFDFYEIHEAFASVVLCTLAAWESRDFCRDKLGLEAALGSIDRAKPLCRNRRPRSRHAGKDPERSGQWAWPYFDLRGRRTGCHGYFGTLTHDRSLGIKTERWRGKVVLAALSVLARLS